MPADEGPLSRWSRRKTATRRGGASPVLPDEPSAVPAVAGEAAPVRDDTAAAPPADPDRGAAPPPSEDGAASDPPDLSDLPDIDTLGPESDFAAFMREGVPAHLRTLALRKLWTSDPVLANLDGLIDYGEDFTDIKSGVFEAVKTVLDSVDKDRSPAAPQKAQTAQPKTAAADEESGGGPSPGRLAEDDPDSAVEDSENQPQPEDKPGSAKV